MTSPADGPGPVILFDGVCNLCAGVVRFVVRHDPAGRFRFAPLQSEAAKRLLGAAEPVGAAEGGGAGERLETMILIADGRVYRKSTAALQTAARLDGVWRLAALLLLVPRGLRDAVYDWVGRRRYRWFGRTQACWLPDGALAARFLDPGQDGGGRRPD
ncbi:Predicted thiol-disulfide oxidoreductase YuxK, DCC family [Tistlia consotensis]|uniref:Predicted thiol-disulfide oxidoreductase YuxK, DCC family n=1 Tax=Tistlia consotensis USBA 355 TaxID=560819 RepID=A0A1Y6CGX9_9PROT|nr:DCC1-like thiol-disulfide oxidoreductase family protein [Tistlia consotensis]SMF63319.1 Predicted thiol-disulfide oxidoreductase YuxK, DCC family [Tistlia consotensis USBA 355]SNR96025.1 Predicted thiol-disulfide oxidoreductase YuxK, DCC family [Tistlia consotensis]